MRNTAGSAPSGGADPSRRDRTRNRRPARRILEDGQRLYRPYRLLITVHEGKKTARK